MKIKKVLSQYRRDFTAIFVCQHCDHHVKWQGYDDDFFHNTVIPNMDCPECGKTGGEVTSSPSVPAHTVL